MAQVRESGETGVNTISKDAGPGSGHLLWLGGFVLIFAVHVLWESLNTMLPSWDMAHHQRMGWAYLEAWQQGELLNRFAELSIFYPPLYYLQEAVLLAFFPQTRFLPLLANAPGIFLTGYCTFLIAGRLLKPPVAACAGLIPLMFPMIAWTSRESLLEIPLAGWGTLALLLVLKSNFFQVRNWSLAFGLVMAAGLLTKWTFFIFLTGPIVYALLASRMRKRSFLHLTYAAILATPLVLVWYLPNLDFLLFERFAYTAREHALREAPELLSLGNFVYYPRSLASYYLFLPLTLFFLWSIVWGLRQVQPSRLRTFLWVTLISGVFLMSLLFTKDPRYLSPLAGPLAILLMAPWNRAPRIIPLCLTGFIFLQFLSVSFRLPGTPAKMALFEVPNDTDYLGIQQEWVFYQSDYYGVAGPPRQENWHYQDLLSRLGPNSKVGFAPELASFNLGSLDLFAIRQGRRLNLERVGLFHPNPEAIEGFDWIIGKSGQQGVSYLTQYNDDVYSLIERLNWPLTEAWELPDGSQARLWRNPALEPSGESE